MFKYGLEIAYPYILRAAVVALLVFSVWREAGPFTATAIGFLATGFALHELKHRTEQVRQTLFGKTSGLKELFGTAKELNVLISALSDIKRPKKR